MPTTKTIVYKKLSQLVWLGVITFVVSVIAGTTLYVFAAFTEPAAAPGSSNQDFTENILGANNADNAFDSSAVVASSTGSIIERLEYIADVAKAYPGRGWVANPSGDGSVALTEAACDAASDWEWFEDANGDGDTTDPEDGICVKVTTVTSDNWGGTETNDNTYIAEYTCAGTFPDGVVVPGGSYPPSGVCALCTADCYDGVKNLPDQGGYTAPDTDCLPNYENCYDGPITPEVLKNWIGTRLPTSLDFYGYCGSKGEDNGDSNYYTGCDATTTIGDNGGQMGRTDECIDLSDTSSEWLSEQHSNFIARLAGFGACSYVIYDLVAHGNRFRSVFRP